MSNKIPTPHIEAKQGDFADVVLMPGDPLRAQFIANNFLTNVKQINSVRGMLGFTGEYNGKKISIMGHGMGNPSIGIYSYELFAFYNVKKIIRIGSCGSFIEQIHLGDIIIADKAVSNSCYAECMNVKINEDLSIDANKDLVELAIKTAKELDIKYNVGTVLSSDAFYGETSGAIIDKQKEDKKILAAEMEAFALYTNAKKLNKEALTILTVSDSIVTHEEMTSEQRKVGFKQMMKLALELASKL